MARIFLLLRRSKKCSSVGLDEVDVRVEGRLLESDGAALCFEPAALGVEVFDLGGESGVELLAGVVAGRFYSADFASDGGELGLAVAEVDLGGVNFFENLEDGRLVICGDG
ncbi:hypothetical protein N9Z03_01480 [Akkermansiaceae bacterium]|nr:hypothetical protein [Akkermansiaceae bacterium]